MTRGSSAGGERKPTGKSSFVLEHLSPLTLFPEIEKRTSLPWQKGLSLGSQTFELVLKILPGSVPILPV